MQCAYWKQCPVPGHSDFLEASHYYGSIRSSHYATIKNDQHLPQFIQAKEGSIVDITIISAPISIKNLSNERDPEMHQVKKGYEWQKIFPRLGEMRLYSTTPSLTGIYRGGCRLK